MSDLGGDPVWCSFDSAHVREYLTVVGSQKPTHIAHSLSDDAQAARREAVAKALQYWQEYAPAFDSGYAADAVLSLLGLTSDPDAGGDS